MLMRFSFNQISHYKFPRNNFSTDSATVVCTRHSISLTGAIAQVKIKQQSLKRGKTMIVRQPRYSKEEFTCTPAIAFMNLNSGLKSRLAIALK